MKIIRTVNGQEMTFELTDIELFNAYEEKQRMYDVEDVEIVAESEDIELTNEQIQEAAEWYRHYRANSESWTYSVREAITRVLEDYEIEGN